MSPREALLRLIAQVGSQSALGALVGATQQSVSYWVQVGRVPAAYCPSCERASRNAVSDNPEVGPVVTCEQINPDVDWSVLRNEALA